MAMIKKGFDLTFRHTMKIDHVKNPLCGAHASLAKKRDDLENKDGRGGAGPGRAGPRRAVGWGRSGGCSADLVSASNT